MMPFMLEILEAYQDLYLDSVLILVITRIYGSPMS